ncbi:MAG: response regulator transcription factor [Acidobacteriia bacterium]|nr:response regulator transcription factor [Terriglobia bacterium]
MQSGTNHVRTVIVDDSSTFLRTVCSFLDHHAAVEVIATAENAPAALLLVEKLRPDLVLMDLQMPGMSGLEATEVLRGRFPAIPVVMLTAHDMPGLRQACKKSGAYEFATKGRLSIELPAILRRLRASLEN